MKTVKFGAVFLDYCHLSPQNSWKKIRPLTTAAAVQTITESLQNKSTTAKNVILQIFGSTPLLLLHFAWVTAYFYPLLLPPNSSFSSNFRLGFVKKVMVCCHQVFNNCWPQKNFPKEEFICCKNQPIKKVVCCLRIYLSQRKSQINFNFFTPLQNESVFSLFIHIFHHYS